MVHLLSSQNISPRVLPSSGRNYCSNPLNNQAPDKPQVAAAPHHDRFATHRFDVWCFLIAPEIESTKKPQAVQPS